LNKKRRFGAVFYVCDLKKISIALQTTQHELQIKVIPKFFEEN